MTQSAIIMTTDGTYYIGNTDIQENSLWIPMDYCLCVKSSRINFDFDLADNPAILSGVSKVTRVSATVRLPIGSIARLTCITPGVFRQLWNYDYESVHTAVFE